MKLDEDLKTLLSYKSDTPAFKVDGAVPMVKYVPLTINNQSKESVNTSFELQTDEKYANIVNEKITLENMHYMVDAMSACIIENEVPFCELDAHAGDGDFGMSVAKGFKQLKREWQSILEHTNTIGEFVEASSLVIMEYCGGASGPIWGSAFRSAGKYVGNREFLDLKVFSKMLQQSVKGIQVTGERSFGVGAVVGDKTLIDALSPCVDALREGAKDNLKITEALKNGAKAAVAGALETEKIVARMGRAGTVGERSIGHPDAGAHALGVIFTEIVNQMK